MALNDGVMISIQNADPSTASNSFSREASAPAKYRCTLDSSSVIHGPILLTNLTINEIS